ncbi:E3 ubiquitin-protein ligase UBR2 isoform X2 [Macrosteles quadrilineatus]|uniref:E3 ubiquitin-protein ligase UBR2 isoform X2 n=1 Tax=Macrosteles quadrilineatus TaxID=74068 RepID=UPI0023E1BD65|nr:E3 ubiquitin-protein ligase UBR2 isoform X2 [Macrosteles quadrilineatus]
MSEIDCTMEVEPQLPVFPDSSKPCVQVWMDKFTKGILSCNHFKDHWRVWVPRIFSPEPSNNCLDWNFDNEKAQQILIDTLEEFICNGDPQTVLKSLSQLDNPPSICGRVFKMGEPTYYCRECGMDATCVLCVDCFKKSVHKNHKYKMGTSSGGGCCDCGDVEAWKNDPYCDIHAQGLQKRQSYGSVLPEDIAERARITFSAVLRYAYQLLTLEFSPGLPADLLLKQSEEDSLNFLQSPDTFCTVLYNDETHTFEQVINTLARVIKCSQRDAIEFVTNIDREGRAVVKCSTFQCCSDLKQEIERFTSRHGNRPLKVLVVHAHVVAHQLYAMRLLTWLQQILSNCEGFRVVFSEVALQIKSPDTSIVEGILLRDSNLWKSARLHWHRLFISGMLMEYESKKAFAKVFTKNYGAVMKDFIRDDHDHSFSVASLAVQIFTVPTLAHYLIAHEDVLLTLFNTFISECSRKTNKSGKLEFERNVSNSAFKRAQYVLYDLRYLLGVIPDVWTDELRKGILQGVTLLLNLLNIMQGMDAVTRQVGQHMEYEPEWESAFNLHIKLAPVITLILKWCGSDRVVLIKAYRATLKKLYENPSFNPSSVGEVRELADHSASCLQYDVSSQPVSIHLPLSRFLAGLHLHLEKFGLHFDSPEFQIPTKQTPEQIIEPVLRTQVMISQVHAGMWRRNGYSLLNQLYFYHNVKCRGEMLDKDVVLLQIGASLIESNEFLIHLLNKYNLINWANPLFETNTLKNPEEDSIRQTISLVEEFLGLLITLVGERYNPGVGQVTHDDCIKKEIVQQLCIKPMSHSELNKTLPDDVNHETGMEKVINDVAVFKKPTQASGKGVYELKPEYYDQYNVFFYHYTREELSKSEEEQRKRRKTAGDLECCPPPPLPPLAESFSVLANLLQCDVMLHIMRIVLDRSINLRARSFSEAQLNKVLHLIGYALHEVERQNCQFLMFTERAEKWDLESLMQMLSKSPRIEVHKDLLTWTVTKFRNVSAARRLGPQAPQVEALPQPSGSQEDEAAKEEKSLRAAKAAEKRAKIMAQMTAMQKSFMKENAKLFQSTVKYPDTEEITGSTMDLTESVDEIPICLGPNQTSRFCQKKTYTCILCQEDQAVTAEGPALVYAAFVQKSTVLSRSRNDEEYEEQDPLFLPYRLGPAPHTSTCGHVMHSTCWQRYFDNVLAKENRRPYRLRQPASFDVEKNEFLCPLCECLNNTVLPLIPALGSFQQGSQNIDNLNLDEWLSSIMIALQHKKRIQKNKALAQQANTKTENPVSTKTHVKVDMPSSSDDTPSNSLVAVATPSPSVDPASAEDETSISIDLSTSDEELEYENEPIPTTREISIAESDVVMQLLLYSRADQNCEPSGESNTAQVKPHTQLAPDILDMILLFSQATFTKGLGAHPNQDDQRVPLMAWKSCAYTIHSLEWLTRDIGKPVLGDLSCRQQDCLEGLVRIAGVLGSTWKQEQVINGHAFRLLSLVLENPPDGPSLLDWDSFGVLVPLTISIPSLFYTEQPIPIPMGTTLELHTLHLMFISNMAQIILTCDLQRAGIPMDEDVEDSETECLREVITTLRGNIDVSTSTVWSIVQENSIPFLRCCVLFYHYLTGVPASPALTEVGGDTFVNMCNYLGLSPTCKELLSPTNVMTLIKKWASHDRVKVYLSQSPLSYRDPLVVNRLVSLPDDYSELINTVSLFTCPNSDREDSRNPTMCLVCGEMLCSQSYCCQTELNKILVGACTFHAHQCGAGACMFLRVRECEILLLASPNRGCFMTPPYLDDYGETDQGLRRGNPLRLCRERYRKLQLLWLSHGIHEEIARAIESSNSLVATQWQHL